MELFYIVTISVAVVLLILILSYVGLKMASETVLDVAYPPNKMRCPDNWKNIKDEESDANYKCVIPSDGELNSGSLYTGSELKDTVTSAPGYFAEDTTKTLPARIDFSVDGWAGYKGGQTSDCSKRTWSSEHGVLWDGVTNYNYCD
jgi:hypothetical protein